MICRTEMAGGSDESRQGVVSITCMARMLVGADFDYGGLLIRYATLHELDSLSPHSEQREYLKSVIRSIDTYRLERRNLCQTRYMHLAAAMPEHFTCHVLLTVTCCSDGVAVAVHKSDDGDGIVGAAIEMPLCDFLPRVSQNYVFIIPDGSWVAPSDRPTITLVSQSPNGESKELVVMSPYIGVRMSGSHVESRPGGIRRIINARSTFELSLVCREIDESSRDESDGTTFITRSSVRLPLAFDELDVFDKHTSSEWEGLPAAVWAEMDILRTAATKNARNDRFAKLDPRFNLRSHYLSLLDDFDKTLATATREEEMQSFLHSNPSFIEPTSSRVWPKLAIGKRVTDFVFRRATGDYLLVELEHHERKLFTKAGVQTAELTHAIDQVWDWYRYIEDNLRTVQNELGLDGISVHPSSLIVIGRTAELTDENRRKLQTIAGHTPSMRIITYDDLRQQTVQALQNVVGPLRRGEGNTEMYFPIGEPPFSL